MKSYSGLQTIKQLEKRKGGYYYLEFAANIINQFRHEKATRMPRLRLLQLRAD